MRARTLATFLDGRSFGDDVELVALEGLSCAERNHVAIALWPKDVRRAKVSTAGCIIAASSMAADHLDQWPMGAIVVEDFHDTFAKLHTLKSNGIFPPHTHEDDARIGEGTSIARTAVIAPNARIGANCVVSHGVAIYDEVVIGNDCVIGANTVIGSEAFVPFGDEDAKLLPSLGRVVIGDGVRIGASCAIDRGLIGATTIKNYTLIDNLVHIGHDVSIGANVIIAAQSGFAGLVVVEDFVTIGGQVGIAPHVTVAYGARISGKSMVHCDIKMHEIWSGNPAVPHALYLRAHANLKRGKL